MEKTLKTVKFYLNKRNGEEAMEQEWHERREKQDRRDLEDRRAGKDRRFNQERRDANDRRQETISVENERRSSEQRTGRDRRTGKSRRSGVDKRGGLDRRLLLKKSRKTSANVLLGAVVMVGLALSLVYYEREIASGGLTGTIASVQKQKLKILGGGKTSLDALLKNGPVLLDFWATWCGPCLKEMVHLQRFHEKYEGYGLTILTINQDDPKSLSKVRSTVKSKKFTFKVALDPNGKVAKRLNAKLMPTTILVDMDGVIRWMHQGYLPGDEIEIEQRIRALLGIQEPAPVAS
ncbi:MAG: hypothetical protein CMG71_08225 [Candidatus Marinimicrobia bacterium]|nr:hypothetical protein [Candidatus Neomarinimicrobiota bacterium]